MQMKRWAAALLAICLLTLCACAAEARPYPQQTQTPQTQDTLHQFMSEELPQEQPGAEETPAPEESETPDEDTESMENEPAEELPEDEPEPFPDEPEDGASDGPEAEPPEDTPEPSLDEPKDGSADAPAEEQPETPETPDLSSDVVTLPLKPGDDAGGVSTKPVGPPASDETEEPEPPVKNNTEDELPDEAEDPQDQNNDRQDDTGQEQEARKTGPDDAPKENSPETEQKNAEQQTDTKPDDVDDGGHGNPETETSQDRDLGGTQEKNSDEIPTPENETSNAPETDQRENMEEQLPDESEKPEKGGTGWMIAFVAAVLLAAAEGAYIWLRRGHSRKKRHPEKEQVSTTQMPQTESIPTPETVSRVVVGKVHAQGARESQQDSFSVSSDTMQPSGLLAVVADGMGGLSDGDKVSQMIVSTVMHAFVSGANTGALYLPALLGKAKLAVDQLLGPDGLRQSGSTVVMGMIRDGLFEYLSVGDSRICLYRDGELHQLNRSHSYSHDLMIDAINGEKTFEDIRTDRRAECLTSYVGMGELKYVDIPAAPIKVHPGDVFVLMSDGVFNALTEQELSAALGHGAEDAAQMIDQWIQKKNYRNQDNYTAVILQCCADAVHESPERN